MNQENRIIKFRVWDIEHKEMYYSDNCDNNFVFLIDYNGIHVETQEYYGDEEEWKSYTPKQIVMQFTGLEDKNKTPIYEGDIVKGCYGIPPVCVKSFVEYDGSAFIIKTLDHTPKEVTLRTAIECLDIEVIGNIHENKELIK